MDQFRFAALVAATLAILNGWSFPSFAGALLPTALRAAFEAPWLRWNLVRTLASTAAFGCSTWALVLTGRVSAAG